MQKICKGCAAGFEITEDDLLFYDRISPVFHDKKYPIPPPTLCPDCRMQRRLAHANRYYMYRRRSSFSQKEIISTYSADKNLSVYESEIWWSDIWDPLTYGREFDFSQPLFGQLDALSRTVPLLAILNAKNENSPYVIWTGWAKNCHLCSGADYSEDCYYSEAIYYSRDTVDSLHVQNLEASYECIDCNNCYELFFSQNCQNCHNAAFLLNCSACADCFGCTALHQKKYCYYNQQLSPEEYTLRVAKHLPYTPESLRRFQDDVSQLALKTPQRCFIGTNNENTSGNYLFHSKNAWHCFDSDHLEDCKYCTNMREARDSMDQNFWGHPGELVYESVAVGEGAYHLLFCNGVFENTKNMYYCQHCVGCSNCFGCSGLRHQEYCIYNRKYTQSEYEKLVPKIIEHMQQTGEWGEFFPIQTSLFAYNETLAHSFFPLSKAAVLAKGWNWRDVIDEMPKVQKVIPAMQLPEEITKIPDDILNWAIICEMTQRPFRITKQELAFYRKHGLPIPRMHPDERWRLRWKKRSPRKIWIRNCGKCNKPIQTTYSPDRPEIVYCEECYLQTVY